jgi:hypothetical protein
MHFGAVLEGHHVLALCTAKTEFGNRGGGVGEKALLESRIDPGFGDNSRAVTRAGFMFVGVDQGIERGWIDESFFDQQRFERLDAQRGVGRHGLMFMVVVVFMSLGAGEFEGARRPGSQETASSSHELLCIVFTAPGGVSSGARSQ